VHIVVHTRTNDFVIFYDYLSKTIVTKLRMMLVFVDFLVLSWASRCSLIYFLKKSTKKSSFRSALDHIGLCVRNP